MPNSGCNSRDGGQLAAPPSTDPRDTLDSDWRNLLVSLEMIHRRVVCDGMKIRLGPYVHEKRRYLAGGAIRKISEIIECAEIEEANDD